MATRGLGARGVNAGAMVLRGARELENCSFNWSNLNVKNCGYAVMRCLVILLKGAESSVPTSAHTPPPSREPPTRSLGVAESGPRRTRASLAWRPPRASRAPQPPEPPSGAPRSGHSSHRTAPWSARGPKWACAMRRRTGGAAHFTFKGLLPFA
jgi:hypothetical protein